MPRSIERVYSPYTLEAVSLFAQLLRYELKKQKRSGAGSSAIPRKFHRRRPSEALIEDDGEKYIAKFSASNDLYSVVKAEFIAMQPCCSLWEPVCTGQDSVRVRQRHAANRAF